MSTVVNKDPLFSFEQFPSLLSQVAEEAHGGLEEEPKSFLGLNRLNRFLQLPECDFEYYFLQASKIINEETFQDLPGSLGRLEPLAIQYMDKIEAVELAIGDSSPAETLKPCLAALVEAHKNFEKQFIAECQAAAPFEPFTVLSRYPNALRLYFVSFLKQLGAISPALYTEWKEAVSSQMPAMLEVFPRLAIFHLLANPKVQIPELFEENSSEIASLRVAYESLVQKTDLLSALRGETAPIKEVRDLYVRICAIESGADGSRRQVFNGVARILYEEAAKIFAIIDHIHITECPRNAEEQCRVVFLALLKQTDLPNAKMPRDFSGIEDDVLRAHDQYQKLTAKERATFDDLFLSGANDAKEKAFYNLIRDWQSILFQWMGQMLFPPRMLVTAAVERQEV